MMTFWPSDMPFFQWPQSIEMANSLHFSAALDILAHVHRSEFRGRSQGKFLGHFEESQNTSPKRQRGTEAANRTDPQMTQIYADPNQEGEVLRA
jgi:hypothetical protein